CTNSRPSESLGRTRPKGKSVSNQLLTKSGLATQFAPQGSQAEQSATEQRNCRAAIGHASPSDHEREVLALQSSSPRPYVGAGRHAEACEGPLSKVMLSDRAAPET